MWAKTQKRDRGEVLWDYQGKMIILIGESKEGLEENVAFGPGPWGVNFHILAQGFISSKKKVGQALIYWKKKKMQPRFISSFTLRLRKIPLTVSCLCGSDRKHVVEASFLRYSWMAPHSFLDHGPCVSFSEVCIRLSYSAWLMHLKIPIPY